MELMKRIGMSAVFPRRRAGALLVLGFLAVSACDRDLLDPALHDGDEAALLQAAGLGRPEGRFTLAGMTVEAARQLARTDRTRARDLLAGLARQHGDALAGAAGSGDSAAFAGARQALRQAQLALVLDALGEAGVERVLAGVAEGLERAAVALDRIGGHYPEQTAPLRQGYGGISRRLEAGRVSLEAGDLLAALDAGTGGAEGLVELRRSVLDLERVRALPDLFPQAAQLLSGGSAGLGGGAGLLAEHERLEEAARVAVAGSDRERAHSALAAVRESELRITIETLGPATAATVVSEVAGSLARLQADSARAEARLRRMLRSATDLLHRADAALQRGDGIAALDLASYAAGLVNSYRLATTRF
jgi:hypothetical protein